MEQKSKNRTGNKILTYRVRLYDRHFSWLKATKELYTQVVQHFFHVLQQEEELLKESDFSLLRTLEIRCIGTKEMKAAGIRPDYPLTGFPKIPLYFRRSAINTAVDLARKKAGTVNPHITLYKGMYQNFTDTTIELKLFNGEKWVWVTYPFTGRSLPPEAERLSPMLVLEKKTAWLEVPLSFEVQDIRTVKERMETEERICAVSFPDHDVLAAAVILSRTGEELEQKVFRGGNEKEDQRRKLSARIHTSEESRGMEERRNRFDVRMETVSDCGDGSNVTGTKENSAKENAALYAGIHDLNRYYAHRVSRQILAFCQQQNIKIIVVPNYENALDFRDKQYLKTDGYRWLGRSIIKNLKYKAFRQGILVTSVRPYHISDCCSECGEKIRKYNEGHTAGKKYYGGKLFVCPNGHKGNAAFNTARNVGKSFLGYFPEEKGLSHRKGIAETYE